MPVPTSSPVTLSALSKHINSHPCPADVNPHHHTLALQVQHNLQYQHDWTDVQLHYHSQVTDRPLPRPLVSGRPPHRVYVHPDDQVEELKRGVRPEEVTPETEWVLPTHLREKWSSRRFADAFDAIEEEPPAAGLDAEERKLNGEDAEECGSGPRGAERRKRRGGKRLLLATLGDDSTVVYYIVHDGIVKPRQN